MTRRTITNLAIGSSLALVLAIGSAVQAGPATTKAEMPMTAVQMHEHCKSMMDHKNASAADTKAQDAALTELAARNANMATMEAEMRQHMQTGQDSMAQCPMMKDTKDKAGQ